MRICLISSEHSPWGGLGNAMRHLASLLASRHEVTLLHGSPAPQGWRATAEDSGVREVFAEVDSELARMAFSCESHRRSAAIMGAIERAYGSSGPDYIEAPDYHGLGLVALQARRAGHPLLRDTLIGVKVSSTAELIALHDGTLTQPAMRRIAELEREQLRLADRLVWRGGDTLDLYRRYYSELGLPEAVRIRGAIEPAPAPLPAPREPGEPLRILYVGRLQRCKGALDLTEACARLPSDDWRLTMIGADTPTAPMGQSVRLTIETMCGEDPRVGIEDPLPWGELQRRWGEHDLLVVPSRFEVWSNVALEAMRAGLPILATPVGGLAEIVEPGVTGWQAGGQGAEPLRQVLVRLLEDRDELERVRVSGAVFERFRRLTDPDEILDGYERLFAPSSRPALAPPPTATPKVTAVIPYHRSSEYVRAAVDSALAQTHGDVDVIIVNDGSFEQADGVLEELAAEERVTVVTQLNGGEPSARNLGARLALGEFVTMLDADNVLEPDFVARAVELLRSEPELAYVTCWLRHIAADGSASTEGSGYAPLGNRVSSEEEENWDGDALAVLPRRIFTELGYRYEPKAGLQSDWELYRRLRADGRLGAVIPEPLARYRVHPESLLRTHEDEVHRSSWNEGLTRRALRRTRWTVERR
ncbi:MAG TPA: glycosyltransferase [Solirubrobacterales bacterium]|nr:glycosyltransferase [Solirubrobacterales bacterium]